MLQDPREGDILDFYGPCDHDPLGKAEVQRQQADVGANLLVLPTKHDTGSN